MKRLNLRIPRPYDYTEQSDMIPVRKKYFCVAEGPTEESYFWGIRNNRAELGIKNDVYIEIVSKEEGQETLSHPMQLLRACLFAMGREDKQGEAVLEQEWSVHCKWEFYDPDIDTVCIIFDRDYKELDRYLDEIFRICERNGIRIVLSNPNFELWLLMHFPDIQQYSPEMLLENKKNLRHQLFRDASIHKRYLEILVSENAKGYTKGSRLKFERFCPNVNLAVKQAELFCEDTRQLCHVLGTSAGRLIQDMRS